MRILHISADYPDPLQPSKTKAVLNLLTLAPEHEHRVISINRVGWRRGIEALDFADAAGAGHRAVAYGAPPKGILHRSRLERLADWIRADCEAAGFQPDLVHAHKISVEGIAGAHLAACWGVPLLVSSQGNTDVKIVGAMRSLRADFAQIWRAAAHVFPFAPWTALRLESLLGPRDGPTTPLPCPAPADSLSAPALSARPVIRTAFHLGGWRNKNALRLIGAIGLAARDVPEIALEIIGGGDPEAFASLSEAARRQAPGRVRFLGHVPNERVQTLFTEATAFALVSHRESYGMVFAEALLAGAPCLIPRGRAIDGYFEEGSVILSADPRDDAEIAAALVRLVREEAAFKARLTTLGAAGGLDRLRRAAVKATYLSAVDAVAAGARRA